MRPLFLIFSLFTFGLCNTLHAQTQSLSFETYMKMVLAYSPQANVLDLMDQNAEAYILKAKSKFEPKLNADYSSKSFDGKEYFSHFNSELKVPTYAGFSAKGGYEVHDGSYLNPESTVPASRLIYAGVEWSIGNGLLMDERRAILKEAKIQYNQAQLSENWLQNELLLMSGLAYIDWEYHTNLVANFSNLVTVNKTRLEQIKASYNTGDKPAIDTLEAFILYQNRQNQLIQAQSTLRKSSYAMKQFLWPDFLPASISDLYTLEKAIDFTEAWVSNTKDSTITALHPLISILALDLSRNDIQQRLNQERFKPTVDLGFNLLTAGAGAPAAQSLQINNNKVTATVNMPLLLREARSTKNILDLKQTSINLKLLEKFNSLVLKENQLQFQDSLTRTQIAQMIQIRDNYQRLLDAEIIKFRIGESSVFLINSRENKLLDYNLKLLKLQAKQAQIQLELLFIKGLLKEQVES